MTDLRSTCECIEPSVCRACPNGGNVGPCELDAFLAEVLEDPEAKVAFDNAGDRHRILDTLLTARSAAGLSAREVSRRMGVSDATVRRLEAEGSDPTVSLVQRYARAVGMRLVIDLKPEGTDQ